MDDLERVLLEGSGIRLDIGCGENKQQGFVGMDKRKVQGVDIVHDLEVFPWPLPDECCLMIIGSHIVEHIKPWLQIELWDEMWRVMKLDGQLALSTPYGKSEGFIQDPTHCSPYNAATFQYFDPRYPLYDVYKPKPWRIEEGFPQWQVTGNMECLLRKISEEEGQSILKSRGDGR